MKALTKVAVMLLLFNLAYAHHNDIEDHIDEIHGLIETQFKSNRESIKLNSLVDSLIQKCIGKIVKIIANNEPYRIPKLPINEINYKNVKLNITLKNIFESNASKLKVNKLQNNMFHMTQEFDLTFPALFLVGDYQAYGTAFKVPIKGSGTFNITTTDLRTWGKAYAGLTLHGVQLNNLDIDYSLAGIQANITGLSVEGKNENEMNSIFKTELLKYYTENEEVISKTISQISLEQTNTLMRGMTVSDVINYLRVFLNN